ncbi:hypothetical protein Scep_025128 [Stephania cephalantha]|uniref:Uncharacterized protein n=1 Tax=Stephania cephalantha TaxID=152367 RepID=A0AAP0HNZ2_9MAGN
MFASQVFASLNIASPRLAHQPSNSDSVPRSAKLCCAVRCQDLSVEPLELQPKSGSENGADWREIEADFDPKRTRSKGISGIRVPRQRYIPVSKAQLLDAITSSFESQQESDEFLRFAWCLDLILHAEHKSILEQLRTDYAILNSEESGRGGGDAAAVEISDSSDEEGFVNGVSSSEDEASDEENNKPTTLFSYDLDLSFFLGLSAKNAKRDWSSDIAVATRFQRAFLKLLRDAQFEELSARDLLLTSALNTDYLLTLPIYVDWKKALESNAIIFRRGYGTEKQNGFLIVDKLDYLQSKLLQSIFFILAKPLGKFGLWINEALDRALQSQEDQVWLMRVIQWFKESMSQQSYSNLERQFDNQLEADELSGRVPPLWLAAQRAVPRYEGLLSPVGPRERLFRRLLMWIGLLPATPDTSLEPENDDPSCELYLRPTFLSRISLGDIWKPATWETCGNNIWKILKTGVSILFSPSILQEPAFQELILLYSEESDQDGTKNKVMMPSLKLKIYENIPIPDLPVIFPHKKLSFRIIDTVRLDVASILGLLAFFVNYKFEDILSSPSAILLDIIAISALIIYVTRVALGYKQTWDRYQLLVNRTLYEKTLASGFGSVHFLLDASEQQQYKEAILAYAMLLQASQHQIPSHNSIGNTCERFLFDKFKEKVEMPIYEAIETLRKLGLVTEVSFDGTFRLQALSCSMAYQALKQRWESLLS